MALVELYWDLVVDLIDRGGNTTTRTYRLTNTDDAGDMDAVLASVTDILDRLADVSLLVVSGYSVNKRFIENALSLPTDAGAEVEAHAEITWPIYQHPEKSGTIDIPGPKVAVFQGTTGDPYNQVDFGAAEVLAYVGIWTFAGDLALISDGEQLANSIGSGSGRRTHSRSRRG